LGEVLAGVFNGELGAVGLSGGGDPDGVPLGSLWTIALWRRFGASWSSRGWEPVVCTASPEVPIVTVCLSARGRRVSAASSKIGRRDRSG
jgi:hypothetical protein